MSHPNAGQMTYEYDFGTSDLDIFAIRGRIYAYLHSNYFPTIVRHSGWNIPQIMMPTHPEGYVVVSSYYGQTAIGYTLYKSGKCIFFFHASTLYNWIKESQRDIAYVDSILDQIEPNTEKIVAKQIAKKLLNDAVYQTSSCPRMQDIYKHHIANCCSWSIAYRTACKRIGINCSYIEGKWNGTNSYHAWNRIKFSNGDILYYDLARAKKNEQYLEMTSLTGYTQANLADYAYYYDYASDLF